MFLICRAVLIFEIYMLSYNVTKEHKIVSTDERNIYTYYVKRMNANLNRIQGQHFLNKNIIGK
jgi:hypothetical protein